MAEGGLSEQRFEERGESSYGESVLGRKTSLCKGPEARKSLEFLGTMEEAVVAGVRVRGHGAREVMGPQCRTLSDIVRAMGAFEGFE